MLWQPSLPERYIKMNPDEAARLITERRAQLGESLVILGHHYQTDDIIRHADYTGDSLKLSQLAAKVATERPVKWVIFCGVHFMAETADMLTPEHVDVILPDMSAGCSMADMAAYEDAVDCWETLHKTLNEQHLASGGKCEWPGRIIPITYVNSTAAVKAFVGANGGACCTSSNARQVFDWAMAGGTIPAAADHNGQAEQIKVLFLPDQHLGRNTAAAYGLDVTTETCLYDPRLVRRGDPLGGSTADQIARAKVILWAGHCSVHKLFRPEHCDEIRKANDALAPGEEPMQILVHPECCKEVVDKADLAGSTEFIIKTIRAAKPGSRWAIGTEVHLVARLAREAAERGVHARILSDCQCLCTTMFRIDQPHLLWVLDQLAGYSTKDGATQGQPKVVNAVRVHPEVRSAALLAVDRMLSLSAPMAKVD
ncbi:MAG: quinolinate synthase NadA [Phycisphaeraceae bacterium]|nr:quinolinate synthase NadA [Phycisphaeraceae bacterium]MBX3365698.1 quinolinate synthase NadA [Phycisphaeraceae bacterium]